MFIFDLLQTGLLHAQAGGTDTSPFIGCGPAGAICPASSFTAIAAAFATQGYFAQADVIRMLTLTSFGLWAPLLYIMAAASGMISLAMGAPPKMYMWFFIGPALYQFLLGTTAPAHGVEWRVATFPQDQREVWKLAEPGLLNSNIVKQKLPDGRDIKPTYRNGPKDPVDVGYMFLWFDELVSSTVQNLVGWTGVYNLTGGFGSESGIIKRSDLQGLDGTSRWYLLSNLKWGMLDQITSARLSNADLRDAFNAFLSSGGGDALSKVIDKKALTIAANSSTGALPCSVFAAPSTTVDSSDLDCRDDETGADYEAAKDILRNKYIQIPDSLRDFWTIRDPEGTKLEVGSFPAFFANSGSEQTCSLDGVCIDFKDAPPDVKNITTHLRMEDSVNAADYLYFIVNGFRWEAAQIYYQIVRNAPAGMTDQDVLFSLFYGWNIRKKGGADGTDGALLAFDDNELQHFAMDLILVHLFRNEMTTAFRVADPRFNTTTELERAAKHNIAESGAKSKYGEVYTWALMIPYVQGVLLYLLAMAYPFACVMMVVPGWHSTLFTWMSFWAWVKLWDLGFSIVVVLERSIWSMLGSSSAASKLFGMTVPMQHWGKVEPPQCWDLQHCPVIPEIFDVDGRPAFLSILKIFDRSLLLGSAFDLDITNAYYIYIMSALYFAVPAVTGQLVLGAKAGASSLINGLIQGTQNDGGSGAKAKWTADKKYDGQQFAAVADQESQRKAKMGGGPNNMIGQALMAGNKGLEMGLEGSAQQTAAQVSGLFGQNLQTTQARANAGLNLAGAIYGQQLYNTSNYGTSRLADLNNKGGYSNQKIQPDPVAAPIPVGGSAVPSGGAAGGDSGSVSAPAKPLGASGKALGTEPASSALGPALLRAGGGALSWGNQAYGAFRSADGILAPFQAQQVQTGLANAAGSWAAGRLITDMQAGLAMAQGNFAAAGFNASSAERGYGMAERRLGAGGETMAANQAWRNRRDSMRAVGTSLAEIGADNSSISLGGLNSDTAGMQMSGMMGGEFQSMAAYTTPGRGGYWKSRGEAVQWMYQNVGQIQGGYWGGDVSQYVHFAEQEQYKATRDYGGDPSRKQGN